MPRWRPISPGTTCRTSGIISIRPRRTRNGNAVSTRRGANRPPAAQRLHLSPLRCGDFADRTMTNYHLDHLQHLETEAIHIMREVAGEFERPALLFSGGKDSIC